MFNQALLVFFIIYIILLATACNKENHEDLNKQKALHNPQAKKYISKDEEVNVKFFPNGDVYIIENYKRGQLNGQVVGFYENRRVNISGYYKEGKRDSLWLFFNQEGKLRKTILFLNDQPIKTWKADTIGVE